MSWKRVVLAGLEELVALCLPNSAILEQPHLQPAHGALASHSLSGLKPLHPLPCPPKAVVSQPDSAGTRVLGRWKFLALVVSAWLNDGMSPCPPPLCCCHCNPAGGEGDISHLWLGPWETRLLSPVPSHNQEQGVTENGTTIGLCLDYSVLEEAPKLRQELS